MLDFFCFLLSMRFFPTRDFEAFESTSMAGLHVSTVVADYLNQLAGNSHTSLITSWRALILSNSSIVVCVCCRKVLVFILIIKLVATGFHSCIGEQFHRVLTVHVHIRGLRLGLLGQLQQLCGQTLISSNLGRAENAGGLSAVVLLPGT